MKGASGDKFGKSSKLDAVSEDRNWISRVSNELTCTAAWHKDWGFLAGGTEHLQTEDAVKNFTIDEQIQKVEQVIILN